LGERNFPRLVLPGTLFDEAERQAFRQAGLDFASSAELLPGEMLLFYQLVTRARRSLTLSYPAVDERGQDLLPSSFLSAVHDCFRPGAIPVERRNMLIEGYDRDVPLCPAEQRVRSALRGTDLSANLAAAAQVVRHRFHDRAYTPFDGRFRDPDVI